MKRDLAVELLTTLKALDEPLNRAAAVIEAIDDGDEKRQFRRALASVAGLVYTDLLVEIEKRFPELADQDTSGHGTDAG